MAGRGRRGGGGEEKGGGRGGFGIDEEHRQGFVWLSLS